MKRITIEEASKLLGIPKQAVRVGVEREKLPIGFAVKMSNRYTYYIFKEKVIDYLAQ